MEISRDVLFRLVKVTRKSLKLADDVNNLLIIRTHTTVADNISGQLLDVLFYLSGEKLGYKQNFLTDASVCKLLKSNMTDDDVTDEIISLAEKNRPDQTPEIFSREEMKEQFSVNGGYMFTTPEGDWK